MQSTEQPILEQPILEQPILPDTISVGNGVVKVCFSKNAEDAS